MLLPENAINLIKPVTNVDLNFAIKIKN